MPRITQEKVACPRCGSADVAKIIWGLPVLTDQLEHEIKLGAVSLGGCCVTGNDPTHECNECSFKWGDISDQ